jgi:hypothetical protein
MPADAGGGFGKSLDPGIAVADDHALLTAFLALVERMMRFQIAGTMVVVLFAILAPAVASAAEATAIAAPERAARVIQSRLIWDAGPHNAFTDLIRWKNAWYCSFREGNEHASYDGKVRILSSADGEKWTTAGEFVQAGHDLRDPKLCVLPDGRLLVGVGMRRQDADNPLKWHTTSRVYITSDGKDWESHSIGDPQVWMWRYVTHGKYVYSFGYRQRPKGMGGETFLNFYRSENGKDWEKITQTDAGGGYVNEAAFVFQPDDRCVVLLRREGGNSRLGLARPPYKEWTWTDLDDRYNGPSLIRLPDGRLLAGGRTKPRGESSAKTALAWLSVDPPSLQPLLTLPSQHETGYPGLCEHDGKLWASYYSSESGKCAIYFAQVELTAAPKSE